MTVALFFFWGKFLLYFDAFCCDVSQCRPFNVQQREVEKCLLEISTFTGTYFLKFFFYPIIALA